MNTQLTAATVAAAKGSDQNAPNAKRGLRHGKPNGEMKGQERSTARLPAGNVFDSG